MTDGVRFFQGALILFAALPLMAGLAEGGTAKASVTASHAVASIVRSHVSITPRPKPAERQTMAQRRAEVKTDMSPAHVQAMAPQLMKHTEAQLAARGISKAVNKPARRALAQSAATSIVPDVAVAAVWGPSGDIFGQCFDVNCGPGWSGDTYLGESLSLQAAVVTEPQAVALSATTRRYRSSSHVTAIHPRYSAPAPCSPPISVSASQSVTSIPTC